METQTQSQEQNLNVPPYQHLAPLAVTSAILLAWKLGYYRSKNAGPEVACGGDSVYFEIPQDTRRKILFGFGPETEVARIEIELINRETQERETFILTKEFPFKECPITLNKSYAFKWRTHEDGHFWSKWSNLKPLVSKSPSFTLSPGHPSRAKNEKLIEKMKSGPRSNILIFGRTGNGKSSFLNGLLTAIAGEYQHAAMTSPEGLTNTQCKTGYELIPGKVYGHDMPGWEKGWEKDAWRMSILEKIVKGELDDITVSQLRGDSHDFLQTTPGHAVPKIDVVILVMSAITLKENSAFHKQMTEFFKQLRVPCLVVMTKMDLIVSDENKPVSRTRFFQDPRVIARYQQAPVDDKFPLVNYDSGEANKPEVDELFLSIIKTCQEKSRNRSPTPA